MAVSRPSKSKANARRTKNRQSRQTAKKAERSPRELLAEATAFLHTGDPEAALPLALRALLLTKEVSSSESSTLPSLKFLAEVNIELGDADAAKNYFLQAVELDPEGEIADDEGGGAEKFLWLAQLCEEGGEDSVRWFERGAAVLRRDIAMEEQPGGNAERLEEKKKKLAGVLCGIIEVYMTDLSLDPSAEKTCTTLITTALALSPTSPTPHQTHASILISQSDLSAACNALRTSLSLWTELAPSHPDVPDFPARISLARLLLEVGMEQEALTVLEGVVDGDEACVEGWYLGGWGLWLLGEKTHEASHTNGITPTQPTTENIKTRTEYLRASRRWLTSCLDIYQQIEYEDERLRDHAVELIAMIEQEFDAGGIELEAEDEDEDEWDGVESDYDNEEEENEKEKGNREERRGKEEDQVMCES